MSGIALYSCESEKSKELKKGDFRIYNVKTPPTNIVLEDIHETDSESTKQIKQIINDLRKIFTFQKYWPVVVAPTYQLQIKQSMFI